MVFINVNNSESKVSFDFRAYNDEKTNSTKLCNTVKYPDYNKNTNNKSKKKTEENKYTYTHVYRTTKTLNCDINPKYCNNNFVYKKKETTKKYIEYYRLPIKSIKKNMEPYLLYNDEYT
ncbi:hypothetical protein BMW23_0304 [Bodo saltans virus]|uniref:Uncharacterized protein n=1 Tax=Bodo saltans virus TaxID=2024608 RepID=A0A2H4UTV3_9VIRU|nr:hypothetical protein QJ851_gp0299 [Bodo saltans virus]ATZ80362.1 hypothetical protein BMW23_0304 [Bodo saltans virus]